LLSALSISILVALGGAEELSQNHGPAEQIGIMKTRPEFGAYMLKPQKMRPLATAQKE